MSLSRDDLDDMRGKNYRMPYAYPTEARMAALLDEIDRLRQGIEAISYALGPAFSAREGSSEWMAAGTARRMVRNLLDPTEGES